MKMRRMREKMLEWERKHLPTLGKPINLKKFATMSVLVSTTLTTVMTGAGCERPSYERITKGYKNDKVMFEIHHSDTLPLYDNHSPDEDSIYAKVEKGELDSAVTWVKEYRSTPFTVTTSIHRIRKYSYVKKDQGSTKQSEVETKNKETKDTKDTLSTKQTKKQKDQESDTSEDQLPEINPFYWH